MLKKKSIRRLWLEELFRVVSFFSGAWIIGCWQDQPWPFLSAALVFYIGWHLFNLYRLHCWLQKSKKFTPPRALGLWDSVFQQVLRLQQRNRKRKRKLTNMLKRFQTSTAAMPDAAVVLKNQVYIEWFNRAAQHLLGLRQIEDNGQHIGKLLRHPEFIDYLETQERQESIKLYAPNDPERILRIHIVPYSGNRSLLIARDITRLHRLEQVRQDFVANVSHELRTPLTVITGFVETMRDSEDEFAQTWERPLALMAEQSARMQNIVNDLLLLARVESEADRSGDDSVAVGDILRVILEEARALSDDKAHRFSTDIDPGLRLYGRADELRSAFSNLLFNAVRYTPPGGSIRLRWYRDAEGAHFAVEDSGEGIAAHHIPRLTERFYRVDVSRSRAQGGTGLGLAIVKHVLCRHQGQLSIDSQLGKGSCFRCDFPKQRIVEAED